MSREREIREAFDDLTRRTRRELDTRVSLRRVTGRGGRSRARRILVPALAAAAVVFVLVGGFALLGLLPGEREEPPPVIEAPTVVETTAAPTTSPTVTPAPAPLDDTTPPSPTTVPADPGTVAGDWFRVRTDLVAADTSDPYLNVRSEPDPSAPILAKLAPTYAGVVSTGEAVTRDDGGTWWNVELIDPVSETAGDGTPPSGWVNAAFLEPLEHGLPVGTDEVPPCSGGESGSGGTEAETPQRPAVFSLRTAELSESCTRFVVGFGSPPAAGTVAPSTSIPRWEERQSNGPLTIHLPGTESAWPSALAVPGGYLVRETGGDLSLVVTSPNEGVRYTPVPERGLLVVDLLAAGTPVRPPAAGLVALTSNPSVGPGTISVRGIARPFEATLGVQVLDDSGGPVEAVFSGSDFLGTERATGYGVMTNDWIEAWGRFALRAEGLAAGDYTLVLDAAGGETPERALRLPFTITEPGQATAPSDSSNDLVAAMVSFARTGDPAGVDLADEVLLGLGDDLVDVRSGEALLDRSAWEMTAPGGFAERSGPFDALDLLATTPWYRVSDGPIPSCASPARSWPDLADLRQVNVEPVGIDSCIEWFAVSVFSNGDGDVEAVVLDLGSP